MFFILANRNVMINGIAAFDIAFIYFKWTSLDNLLYEKNTFVPRWRHFSRWNQFIRAILDVVHLSEVFRQHRNICKVTVARVTVVFTTADSALVLSRPLFWWNCVFKIPVIAATLANVSSVGMKMIWSEVNVTDRLKRNSLDYSEYTSLDYVQASFRISFRCVCR